MADMKSLLVEIGTEELPPKALPELARAFFDGVCAGLEKRGVEFDRTGAAPLYSPRRLAVLLPAVALQQPTQKSDSLGPYKNIGLDAQGQPTQALVGFAAKNGVEISQLQTVTDGKGERFVARTEKPGAATADLLPEIINEAVKALPIPKPMRWGNRDIAFVRPAHWLLVLLGENVVDAEVLGLRSDRMSRGHRFHHGKPVWISVPEDYVDAMRQAYVLVDPVERLARVREEIESAAARADGVARVAQALLQEVSCLVEWPRAILCSFEPQFLRVPHEALISTMESNQKFFPVLNREHRLTEHFVGIANIESSDPSEVRKGYERVIRPRFADAQFFFDEDLKQGIESMREGLASVTYQQKLGSYADKTDRVATLASAIAHQVGVDAEMARRAAQLSKADLQSRMVGEFPELQGIMGRYYATAIGETGDVADAIDHAYLPRFGGDAIAPSRLSQVLAVAERLDTLAGGFAAGLKPSGNKDPFALRRNALGLARTLVEGQIDCALRPLLTLANAGVGQADPAATEELAGFIIERLRSYYGDQGLGNAQFDAVSTLGDAVESLADFDQRLKAIAEFAKLPEAPALAAANKRIRNILRKNEGVVPDSINAALLVEPAEKALDAALAEAINDTTPLLAARDYLGVLRRLAQLREPVDAFFDGVMVMADDAAVRGNRLALLRRLADRFAAVAAVEQLSNA
ncbi:MAG: glycine--tRNA ligase subunit beta [Gammaproteobacteria bacterium RIFCSPHIGHO2_12_FULL_63_22]|nr:MAG: glycine--tRNA ligase subunit beta [Gammaproteobacteria bacterium RIFCSPHIGHO2_12_FULL_63_22]